MTDQMIQASNLTKYYGEYLGIDDICFSVAPGETVGLLGTNGSGKTTTMRLLAGYMPPSSGTIRVAGFDMATHSLEARRHIGYMPESVALYADMTVTASLEFFGRVRGMASAPLGRAVARVLETCGLAEYRGTLIGKLSKGYKQRLGFAQAVLHEPDVLILDEPTASIDPVQVVETRELIRELGNSHTVLLSTHQLSEASGLCNRVIILHNGIIAAQGHPAQIAERLHGANRVRIEAKGSIADVVGALKTVNGADHVHHLESIAENVHAFEITTTAQQDVRELIAPALAEANLGLVGLTRSVLNLEEVFLGITQAEPTVSTHD